MISRDVTFNENYFPLLSRQVAKDDKDQEKLQVANEDRAERSSQVLLEHSHENEEVQPTPTKQESEPIQQEMKTDSQIFYVKKSTESRRRRTQVERMLEAQSRLRPEYNIPKNREIKEAKHIERFCFNNLLTYALAISDFQKIRRANQLQGGCGMQGFN